MPHRLKLGSRSIEGSLLEVVIQCGFMKVAQVDNGVGACPEPSSSCFQPKSGDGMTSDWESSVQWRHPDNCAGCCFEALTSLLLTRNARVALEAARLLKTLLAVPEAKEAPGALNLEARPVPGLPKLRRRIQALLQDLGAWQGGGEAKLCNFTFCSCQCEAGDPARNCQDVQGLMQVLDEVVQTLP